MSIKNTISLYLEKLGIKDPTKDLTSEEKITLESWKRILSGGEISVDRIKEFCEYQLNVIETKFRDAEKSDREKANLTLIHSVYSAIKAIIVSPRAEQESLEKYLNTLIHNDNA